MNDAAAIERMASVSDNAAMNRFELSINGDTAFLQYERSNNAVMLMHTEVPDALRGRRLGDVLAERAIQSARSAGLLIVAVCPFVREYMRKRSTP